MKRIGVLAAIVCGLMMLLCSCNQPGTQQKSGGAYPTSVPTDFEEQVSMTNQYLLEKGQ